MKIICWYYSDIIYIWVLTYVNWVSICYIERRPSWADAMTICQRLRSSVDPAMDHDSLQTPRFANMQNYTLEWVIIWCAMVCIQSWRQHVFFRYPRSLRWCPRFTFLSVPLFRGVDITNRWHPHKLLLPAAWMMPMPLARRALMAPQVGERRGFHKWNLNQGHQGIIKDHSRSIIIDHLSAYNIYINTYIIIYIYTYIIIDIYIYR